MLIQLFQKTSTQRFNMSDCNPFDPAHSLPASVMIFGCGYVGSALAARLLERGVRVGALTRNPERAAALRALGVSEVVEADLHTSGWWGQVSRDYQAVVNCVSSAGGGIEGYRLSYVEGQARILEWLAGGPSVRYVYTSSTSVYPQDGGVEVDETADLEGASPTTSLLLESERLLSDASVLEHWYVLRLAGIYGPGRHHLLDQLREGAGVIPGRGDYTMNMIHREDAVSAILVALAGGASSGIYNICDNEPSPKFQVLNWLAGQLGQPAPRFDPTAVSPRLQRRGGSMPDRRISNRKARRVLGWVPCYRSFREGYASILKAMDRPVDREKEQD